MKQGMPLTPNLYFGTRRCTYSDVISIVTTVKPLPRINTNHPEVQDEDQPHPVYDSPLESDAYRKQKHRERRLQALAMEKEFFMQQLYTKRKERLELEHHAALVIQRVHRGYSLRKKFLTIKRRFEMQKKIRTNLNNVAKGTALILCEKDRTQRKNAIQTRASIKIQCLFRRFVARRMLKRERFNRQLEFQIQNARLIQRNIRLWIVQAFLCKLKSRLQQEREKKLASIACRIYLGYKARQEARALRIRRDFLAICKIQFSFRCHLAKKTKRLEEKRRPSEKRHQAAYQIQRICRGFLARRKVLFARIEEEKMIRLACILFIQRVIRGFLGRKIARTIRYSEMEEKKYHCTLDITRIVRGFLGRNKAKMEQILQESDIFIQTRLGNLSVVVDLLDGYGVEEAIDILSVDKKKNTILHIASRFGHLLIISHCLPKMIQLASVHILYARNEHNDTPLELAIKYQHEEVADYLLTKNALIEFPTRSLPHRTLLHDAARNGMYAIVEKILLLFGNRFTGNEEDTKNNRTPLHDAVLSGDLKTVTVLLTKSQTFVNAQDEIGFTPIHHAAQIGNLEIIKSLLNYGADVTLTDKQNRTAWRLALLEGHESCYTEIRQKWLRETGKDLLNLIDPSLEN
jgi:ankyrin repeat protein